MATYDEIYGKRVEVLSSDPTLNSTYEGQVWYNSATGTLKSVVKFASWTSTGNRPSANSVPAGNGGTQNAGWTCGNDSPPGTNYDEYNGAGWATGEDMSTARRYGQGWGTQTAAITASGSPLSPPNVGMTTVEEYNGSSWTSGTAVPAPAKRYHGGAVGAVKTSGLIFCGDQNPPPLNTTFEWDDSSWTAGGAYPFAGSIGGGSAAGTVPTGIAMGGPGNGNVVSTYDGSSWTTTTTYPASKSRIGVAGAQTAAIGFGGGPATTAAFLFDGSTFSATASLGTSNGGSYGQGGSSPSTATLNVFEGAIGTEEYSQSINTISPAAFSAGPNMNNGREGLLGGAGTNTAAIAFGGYKSSAYSNLSEGYNGSAWSNLPTLNTGRASAASIGATQTAAIMAGGTVQRSQRQSHHMDSHGAIDLSHL